MGGYGGRGGGGRGMDDCQLMAQAFVAAGACGGEEGVAEQACCGRWAGHLWQQVGGTVQHFPGQGVAADCQLMTRALVAAGLCVKEGRGRRGKAEEGRGRRGKALWWMTVS